MTNLTIESLKRGIHHTMPIAIGRDNADHAAYEQLLYVELQQLQNVRVYYDGLCRKPSEYQFILYAAVCDRPEVSDMTGIGYHNGTCSALPGISAPILVAPTTRNVPFEVKKYLLSCAECHTRRLLHLRTHPSQACKSCPSCTNCCDWNLEHVEYRFTGTGFQFPIDETPEIDGWLKGCQNSFKSMGLNSEKAFMKSKDGLWSKKVLYTYLRSLSQMSESTAYSIYDASQLPENNQKTSPPDECLPAPLRSNVFAIELERMIPGIMHLLFLGISKTVLMTIAEQLKKYSRYTSFHREVGSLLKSLRSLSLQFCKAWAFGSAKTPTGPWVSENCMAFTRIMKSVFSCLETLEARGNGLPREPVLQTRKVIWSYVAVVSRIMQDEYNDTLIDETEACIKIFLTEFERLDSSLRQEKKKPTIESSTNFIYILRLPDMMRKFGPLREFWEGSIRGEGIFRYLKPLVRRGVHNPGVPRALLKKFYADTTLSWILDLSKNDHQFVFCDEEDDSEDILDDETSRFLLLSKRYTDIHTYRDLESLVKAISNDEPLGIVHLNDGSFHAQCNIRGKKSLIPLSLVSCSTVCSFPTFIIAASIGSISQIDLGASTGFSPCLASPVQPSGNGHDQKVTYSIVTENWLELDSNFLWVYPQPYETR